MIDQTGREVVKPEYFKVERVQSCFLAEKNGACDIFDLEGNLLSEQFFSSADGIKLYNKEQGISGIICQGSVYAFDTYYYIWEVIPEQRLAIVQFDKSYGVINFEGEMQIPFSYRTIWYYESENVFLVENAQEKWGVLDGGDFTAWCIPCSYDSIHATDSVKGMVRVEKDEAYGIIDLNGGIVLPISYDRIEILENGAYFARKDDVSWLYDKNGTLLNQGNYSYISYKDGCYRADEGECIGYLNVDGKKIFSAGKYYFKSYIGFSYPGIEILRNYVYVGDADTYLVQNREIAEDELPECLFENKITPRTLPFWEFIKDGSFEADSRGISDTVNFSHCDCEKVSYKFYDFSHTGRPVLYVVVSSYDSEQVSGGFFALEGTEVVCLLSGYECGGTLGGDYLCLWYDKEGGKLLFGKDGYVGNMAQYDSYSEIYDYEGGFFLKYSRLERGGTYSDSEYYLDGDPVTVEEYLERTEYCEKRYEYISLQK